jgi:hypothetical protein
MPKGAREGPLAVSVAATVEKAIASLPDALRSSLGTARAAEYEVVARPIGEAVDHYRRSGGLPGLPPAEQARLENAHGVWISELGVVLIRGDHPVLCGLDASAAEQFIAHVVWHEAAHALSISNCSWQDRRDGRRLLELCPPGIAEDIRSANYGVSSYTHEVVAEVFALLMGRRQRGQEGRPPWLDQEIYDLICRVTGWTA